MHSLNGQRDVVWFIGLLVYHSMELSFRLFVLTRPWRVPEGTRLLDFQSLLVPYSNPFKNGFSPCVVFPYISSHVQKADFSNVFHLHMWRSSIYKSIRHVIRGLPVSPMNNFSFASAPLGFQHGNAARPLSNIQSIMATYHVEVFNTRTSIFSSDRPSST